MIYLRGSDRSFHCRCGSNIFVLGPGYRGYETWLCNACGTEYESERLLPELPEIEYHI